MFIKQFLIFDYALDEDKYKLYFQSSHIDVDMCVLEV